VFDVLVAYSLLRAMNYKVLGMTYVLTFVLYSDIFRMLDIMAFPYSFICVPQGFWLMSQSQNKDCMGKVYKLDIAAVVRLIHNESQIFISLIDAQGNTRKM